jgi:glycosyltransferase involved in cell wall biosynthesis
MESQPGNRSDPSAQRRAYNVLMLAPTMFFADYGAHVRILEEARVLRKLGHRVTILAYPNGRNIAGLHVRRCRGVPFNYRVIVGSSRHKIFLDMMLGLKSISHTWGTSPRPDIIHAHLHEGGLIGWMLSKLTGVPLILDFQGSLTSEMLDHNFISPDSPFFRPLRWLEEWIDHRPQAILTSSQHATALLVNRFGVPPGRVHPTPDCVNAREFDPSRFTAQRIERLRTGLGIAPGKKVIVYLGVLAEYQGTGKLLEAAAALKAERDDFHLLIMGYPGEAAYRAQASALGLADEVTFTGRVPYERAALQLALGDVAVAPKISATEGSGKILNYMSMALPTVAFDTPVSREYLSNGGLYAPELTAPALTDTLRRALDLSPSALNRLGRYLRYRASTLFAWDPVGQQIELVYDAVLAGDPQPALAVRRALQTAGDTAH